MVDTPASSTRDANLIEESLRFDNPVVGLWRTAACPPSFSRIEVEASQPTMARHGTANRDVESFDILRSNATTDAAFGVGSHFCIGAALARQDSFSGFQVMFEGMDDLPLSFTNKGAS